MRNKYFAQGDLLAFPIEKLPDVLKKRDDMVVVDGLNRHLAEGGSVVVYDGFLSAPEGCVIKHPEHNPITLDPGHYEIKKVLEYDHFLEESREVID